MGAAWRTLWQSRLKLLVILITWPTLLIGLYALMLRGLAFIYSTAGLGPFLLDRVWYLFLFIVSVMLAISQMATAFSTLVRSAETCWWLSLPISARQIMRAKWIESSLYSAWAVVLLVIPLCLAYTRVLHQPVWLVGWALCLLVPLIGIMTAVATIALLVWLRWLGRLVIRRELIPVAFLLVCLGLFWLLGESQRPSRAQEAWFAALQDLLPRMHLAMSMWWPSSWMARALNAGLNDRWVEGLVFLTLLWSTALVVWRALDHVAAWQLLPVLWRQAARHSRARHSPKAGGAVAGRWWMRHPLRACMAKDLLLLLRDPAQWGQGLMFFGLLGAYFANIHRVAQASVDPSWRIGIASLNLACTVLVFGSLAVRFLFPQMSLEGRRIWLIHVAPGGVRRLMHSKLLLYGTIAVLVIESLLSLFATRLEIPVGVGVWLSLVGIIAALSLIGLTLGLGAWYIDVSSVDPARIVSSSNGALTLLLMLLYVGCLVWSLVLAWVSIVEGDAVGLLEASGGLIAISLVIGLFPLLRGYKRLERLEL